MEVDGHCVLTLDETVVEGITARKRTVSQWDGAWGVKPLAVLVCREAGL